MVNRYLLFIFLADGLLWLRSSLGKFLAGNFPAELGGTLSKFASNNPYPWYKSLLLNQAVPQSNFVGIIVMYLEALGALLIIVGVLGMLLDHKHKWFGLFLLKGLIITLILNMMFWLASGWTSPSTDSLNLFMGAVEITGILYLLRSPKK